MGTNLNMKLITNTSPGRLLLAGLSLALSLTSPRDLVVRFCENMQGMSSRHYPVPVDTGPPRIDDRITSKPPTTSEKLAEAVVGNPIKNVSNTDEQIPDGLQGLPTVQERNKDVESKFWATYDEVSTEYDDDFLERANGDMGIILTFAGLFSAVNSTFIIGMQPDPAETTNILLFHLIQMTANGTSIVHDISGLSPYTLYPSSTVWMQTLAYASLSFSVLAAFGAVMGKQWLNAYKAARGRGSLEERCIQRQRKMDGMEYFQLQTVLQGFLVVLQISLLLFGLSLSANMWTQQTTISSVVICSTAFGILFYASALLVTILRPDSPFRTPGAELMGAICRKLLRGRLTFTPDSASIKLSAIRWILETSTHPEVVVAVAAMIPFMQWPQNLDVSAICGRLNDNLAACYEMEEVFVKCGKAIAHLYSQSLKIPEDFGYKLMYISDCWGGKSRFIHDAFMDSRNACNHLKNTQKADARQKHKADARTALRTLVVYGHPMCFSFPDDERLIWHGDLRWRYNDERIPSCEEFDWLIDYLVEADVTADDETVGDALLALSAMPNLRSSTKRHSYITALIHCIDPARPPRVRHAALRAIADARDELASMTNESIPQGVDATLLDKLSCAILTAIRPEHSQDQTIQSSGPDASFHEDRDTCYSRLILALAQNDEWRERLTRDGHFEHCVVLAEHSLEDQTWLPGCYLAGIFAYINSSDKVFPLSPTQKSWQAFIREKWKTASLSIIYYAGAALPALAAATRHDLQSWDSSVPNEELTELTTDVHRVLELLQKSKDILVYLGIDQALFDAALSSVQGLYDDLRRMIENPNTSQTDNGPLES
ncbi:hypothetical protein C8R48DRAFT_836547 [Suillus tomentosus]|nr:hypothetical protein C8R48DRAFT_836547 [Suillus tomentosus]